MKKILSIVLVIIILISVGYFIYTKTNSPTSNFQTYTNEQYKFSIDYPKNASIEKEGANTIIRLINQPSQSEFISDEDLEISINVQPLSDIRPILSETDPVIQLLQRYQSRGGEAKITNINNTQGVYFKPTNEPLNGVYYQTINNGISYLVIISTGGVSLESDMQKILNSFKLSK